MKNTVEIKLFRIISKEKNMSVTERNMFLREKIRTQLEEISGMEKTIQQQERRINMLAMIVEGFRKLLLEKSNTTKTSNRYELLTRLLRGNYSEKEIEALGKKMRN